MQVCSLCAMYCMYVWCIYLHNRHEMCLLNRIFIVMCILGVCVVGWACWLSFIMFVRAWLIRLWSVHAWLTTLLLLLKAVVAYSRMAGRSDDAFVPGWWCYRSLRRFRGPFSLSVAHSSLIFHAFVSIQTVPYQPRAVPIHFHLGSCSYYFLFLCPHHSNLPMTITIGTILASSNITSFLRCSSRLTHIAYHTILISVLGIHFSLPWPMFS